jgi:hypothetical protein
MTRQSVRLVSNFHGNSFVFDHLAACYFMLCWTISIHVCPWKCTHSKLVIYLIVLWVRSIPKTWKERYLSSAWHEKKSGFQTVWFETIAKCKILAEKKFPKSRISLQTNWLLTSSEPTRKSVTWKEAIRDDLQKRNVKPKETDCNPEPSLCHIVRVHVHHRNIIFSKLF